MTTGHLATAIVTEIAIETEEMTVVTTDVMTAEAVVTTETTIGLGVKMHGAASAAPFTFLSGTKSFFLLQHPFFVISKEKKEFFCSGDATRLAEETSLLITDIVVELADHSIANVEILCNHQLFPPLYPHCMRTGKSKSNLPNFLSMSKPHIIELLPQ